MQERPFADVWICREIAFVHPRPANPHFRVACSKTTQTPPDKARPRRAADCGPSCHQVKAEEERVELIGSPVAGRRRGPEPRYQLWCGCDGQAPPQ
jgi:hypothetical protein